MRHVALGASLALAVLLAACGSSGTSTPPPLFGGFQPADSTAIVFPPTMCNVPFVGLTSISGVAIVMTDHTRACEMVNALASKGLCGTRASSTEVRVLAARGVPGSGGVAPVDPGVYPYLGNPPVGPFRGAIGGATRVDASCIAASGNAVDMVGGSVTLTTVTPTRVAGSVDMTLGANQTFDAGFDATVCTSTIDLCAVLNPCFSSTCVP